jgi:anti-anti-sigma regulatory factor
MTIALTAPTPVAQPVPKRGGVRFTTNARSGATVVAAHGELDAANIHDLIVHAHCRMGGERALILDLHALGFLGGRGIAALLAIGEHCADAALPWTVIPSPPVRRLLVIGDPDGLIPTADSLTEALTAIGQPDGPRPALELVAPITDAPSLDAAAQAALPTTAASVMTAVPSDTTMPA